MDTLTPEARSELMSRIKGKDTKPELYVRSLIHRLGYRFRLHRKDLPGKPDLVFPSRRKVVFVHGCFWHHHENCRRARIPKTHIDFWSKKFEENRARDGRNLLELEKLGWRSLVIWECEISHGDTKELIEKIEEFLE